MHDATKVMLGAVGSSDREISAEEGDPAVLKAGYMVRRASNGAMTYDTSEGTLVGVSLGESLSDTEKVAVCRVGNRVPVLLKNEGAQSELEVADLTFTAVEYGEAGDDITITLEDGGTAGDEEVEVTGTDIVVSMDSGVSTAQQIADAIEASEEASALVTVAIADGEEATAQVAAVEAPLAGGVESYPYAVPGGTVKVETDTGLACSDGTSTGAVYLGGALTGVYFDGTTAKVAEIDMGGGL